MGTELSSGQRTLIGIVRATLHRPRLLVLDEPTASLDPDVAQRVRAGLLDICDRDGTALLMTSHDMSDVVQVCERVVFLSHGTSSPTVRRRVSPSAYGHGDLEGVFLPSRGVARDRPARNRVITRDIAHDLRLRCRRRPLTGRAKSWLRMRAIARRHAYVLVRSPHRLFDVTLWPLVDVLLFGSLAAFVGTSGSTPAAKASGYLLAGIVLWHVIYQSQIAMSTGLLEETWTRNLLNLMVTPLREVEYLAGVALFGMVKLVIGVGVMVLGALAFFSFHTWSLGCGPRPDRRGAARRRLGDLVVRDGSRAALRHRRGGARVGRDVRAVAAVGRLLSDRGLAHVHATDRARAAHDARVHGACARSSTATATTGCNSSIAAVGSVAMLGLSMWFLVAMLRTFRKRGYITRYT